MSAQQPVALRLADNFDHPLPPEWSDMQAAAAELRRLHAANLDCMAWYEAIKADYDKLKAEHERLRLYASGSDKLVEVWKGRAQDFMNSRDRLHKAAIKLHAAKGRYHTQIAACDLYDLLGLKNKRPTK